MLRGSSTEFEAGGRVLRLRQFLRADVRPRVLDAVLDALEANTRVEALYIQNFEQVRRLRCIGLSNKPLSSVWLGWSGLVWSGLVWAEAVCSTWQGFSKPSWHVCAWPGCASHC
jgi:hypothetical protein